MITPLRDATDPVRYGGKAAALGAAARAGLPVPDGLALSVEAASAVASGGPLSLPADWPVERAHAVRSSALGEDSGGASFAGVHDSLLGVTGLAGLAEAVRTVHASGHTAEARGYRGQLGLQGAVRMAVVIQLLVEADVAGVMFTRNPVTGAVERVVEASWGLGEAVVSGLVTPDRFVIDHSGRVSERRIGEKDLAIRRVEGRTVEQAVSRDQVTAPCLGDAELTALHRLAEACDDVFGDDTGHDIEFAFQDGALHLLQRRPITRV